VPLSHIKSVEVKPNPRAMKRGIRLPGTYWPGKISAGSYWDLDTHEWSFWNIRSGKNAIVIELDGERYKRLVLELDDPERVVEMVRRAIG
jgi:hypothetical protein